MRVLSLFDGISCARVALGTRVTEYYAFEVDPEAVACSARNWPDIRHMGDVRSLDVAAFHGIDLLIGGSPCQDLSRAKVDGRGLDGDKSSLFWEYVRALEGVKPRWFVFENVHSMGRPQRDAISAALGVQPILLNASWFSAQSRKRLFWTNIPLGAPPAGCPAVLGDVAQSRDEMDERDVPRYLADSAFHPGCAGDNTGELHAVGSVKGSTHSTERVHADTGKAPTLRCASRSYFLMGDYVRQLTTVEKERLQGLPDNYTAGMRSQTARAHALGNAFHVGVVSWILGHIPAE